MYLYEASLFVKSKVYVVPSAVRVVIPLLHRQEEVHGHYPSIVQQEAHGDRKVQSIVLIRE